jgi:2-oxoglutarate ferredoxin oxidoreductase subunit gamma
MDRQEVRVSGFGGQGIILSGYIVGKAASIHDGKQATMVQAYGPEARGSACSSQVVVADEQIDFPYLSASDILVSMSQEAYDKFIGELREGGILLIDETLVKMGEIDKDIEIYSIPATEFAEELGRKIVANIVMLGFVAGATDVVTADAMRQAVASSVPAAAVDLNMKAFDKGYEYGVAQRAAGGAAAFNAAAREEELVGSTQEVS